MNQRYSMHETSMHIRDEHVGWLRAESPQALSISAQNVMPHQLCIHLTGRKHLLLVLNKHSRHYWHHYTAFWRHACSKHLGRVPLGQLALHGIHLPVVYVLLGCNEVLGSQDWGPILRLPILWVAHTSILWVPILWVAHTVTILLYKGPVARCPSCLGLARCRIFGALLATTDLPLQDEPL